MVVNRGGGRLLGGCGAHDWNANGLLYLAAFAVYGGDVSFASAIDGAFETLADREAFGIDGVAVVDDDGVQFIADGEAVSGAEVLGAGRRAEVESFGDG